MKHEVIIVGGGVSGTALLYTLSKYSNIKNVGLIEKYSDFGLVNSASVMNSQTLHFGDIETNYKFEKAKRVKRSADMVKNYLETEKKENSDSNLFSRVTKMVLAIGADQVKSLETRFETFSQLFPDLRMIGKEEIGRMEPRVTEGRDPGEELLALATNDGYTVDFGRLCHSFVTKAKKDNPALSVYLSTKVLSISRDGDGFRLKTDNGDFEADAVVVTAGSHSLKFAKSLGYGKDYSILSMAGSFYIGPKALNGKVYTMQLEKLPFAAIHGDPEVHNNNITRFGPTAKPIFFLERYNRKTFTEYWRTFGFGLRPVLSIFKIISDRTIFKFILKNIIYDLPLVGKNAFLREVRKIVPGIKPDELKFARKIGGTRPQIINNTTRKLEMGEAKICGDKIIFNITPSPGASTCLGNAFEDAVRLTAFLGDRYTFNSKQFEADLLPGDLITLNPHNTERNSLRTGT